MASCDIAGTPGVVAGADPGVCVTHIEFTDDGHAYVEFSVSKDHVGPVFTQTFHVNTPADPNGTPQTPVGGPQGGVNAVNPGGALGFLLPTDGCTQVDIWTKDANGNDVTLAANYNYDLSNPSTCSDISVFNPTPQDGPAPAVPASVGTSSLAVSAPTTTAASLPPAARTDPTPSTLVALTATPSPASLPVTGADSAGLVGLGLALVLAGYGIKRMGKRLTRTCW